MFHSLNPNLTQAYSYNIQCMQSIIKNFLILDPRKISKWFIGSKPKTQNLIRDLKPNLNQAYSYNIQYMQSITKNLLTLNPRKISKWFIVSKP